MIAFLFIGGAHQVFHLAPVAAELSRMAPARDVVCFFADDETGAVLARVQAALAAPAMRLERIEPPKWGGVVARLLRRRAAIKGPLLWRIARRLRGAEAVVTPERTSSALRFLGLGRALLIHFRHGAGDRAPASERKLSRFDLVVVAGAKDVVRAIERHGLAREALAETGYVKLDFLSGTGARPQPVFGSGRPLVVYNPHFDATISSLPAAEAVIAAFRAQDRYDLMFAPHIRFAEDMDAATRAKWEALAVPGRILIDLDSPRLIDMSYLFAADVYLGDMSSQLYEFLARPRPVAFLDSHGADWRGDPRYAGWALGEVATAPDEVIAAIDRAVAGHDAVREAQARAVAAAFGDYRGAARRGAQIVLDAIARRGLVAPKAMLPWSGGASNGAQGTA